MNEMIAYCGLTCHTCPIYLATHEEDNEKQRSMRTDIARLCNEKYGTMFGPGDITDCDGCPTEQGRLFRASQSCETRKCARQRGVENCAHCSDYICVKLKAFFDAEPEAKTRLDEVRRSLSRSAKRLS
jgi:hypothetical protein